MKLFIKILKIIGIVLASLYLLIGIFYMIPRSPAVPDNGFLVNGGRPVIIAHGGGNHEFPDNTLEAYYNAFSIDPNFMLETDVAITRDGVVILTHDLTLDRKTNVTGFVHDWNYSDLMAQEVDFNYHSPVSGGNRTVAPVPFVTYAGRNVTPLDVAYPPGVRARHPEIFLATTLEELIIAFPNNTINVEIKQTGEIGLRALASVIEMMQRLDSRYRTFDRIVLASFHDDIFAELKRYKQEIPQLMFSPNYGGAILLYVTHWIGLDFIFNEPVTVFTIPTSQGPLPLNWQHFIRAIQRHNIAVHYWTINDEAVMRDLISKGADGIITDRPGLLKAVLDDIFGPGNSPRQF